MKWIHTWEIFANELLDEHAMLMRALANRYLSECTFPTLGAAVTGAEPEDEPTIQFRLRDEIEELEAEIARLTADIEEINPSVVDLDSLN